MWSNNQIGVDGMMDLNDSLQKLVNLKYLELFLE
jgi:hypothetical protein